VLYCLVLTLFLVHPDAFALFGAGAKGVESDVDATVPGALQHLSAYALLGILLSAGFVGRRRPAVWIGAAAMLHGLATESIQAFVPNRTFDWGDLAANLVGGLVSIAVCSRFGSRSQRRLSEAVLCVLLVIPWGCSRVEESRAESSPQKLPRSGLSRGI